MSERGPHSSQEVFSPREAIEREIAELHFELMIDQYRPKYLGAGSEQVVFEIPDHPNIVAKVDQTSLEKIIQYNLDHHWNPSLLDGEVEAEARKKIKEEFAGSVELRKFFGDAVLREKRFLQQVPITRAMLVAVSKHPERYEQMDDAIYDAWAIVRVQERLPKEAFDTSRSVELGTKYLERSPMEVDQNTLERWTEDLLDGEGESAEAYLAEAWPDYERVKAAMAKDSAFAEAIKEFAETCVRYTQFTGNILDLAGLENAILYWKNKRWNLSLPDARYPDSDLWTLAHVAVEELMDGDALSDLRANHLLNTLNYSRFVNALNAVVGSTARLRLHEKKLGPIIKPMITRVIESLRRP